MWRDTLIWILGMALSATLTGCAGTGNRWVDSEWLVPTTTSVDSTQCTYTWTPPTTGTPVTHYLLQSTTGQEWIAPRAKLRITVPADMPHRVRVQGVDADSIAGPWSAYSATWPGRADDLSDRRDDYEIKP